MNMNVRQLVGLGIALVVGLLLGWMVRGVATYNSAATVVTPYSDWRTACPPATEKDASCEVMQDIVDGKTKSEVARVAMLKEKGKLEFGVTMPFDVLLEPGIGIAVGTNPVQVFPYRTCNTVGCLAIVPIDDKLAGQLKGAKDARLLLAGLDGKPVALPLSLKGYDDANRAFQSAQAKRTSWFWRLWS